MILHPLKNPGFLTRLPLYYYGPNNRDQKTVRTQTQQSSGYKQSSNSSGMSNQADDKTINSKMTKDILEQVKFTSDKSQKIKQVNKYFLGIRVNTKYAKFYNEVTMQKIDRAHGKRIQDLGWQSLQKVQQKPTQPAQPHQQSKSVQPQPKQPQKHAKITNRKTIGRRTRKISFKSNDLVLNDLQNLMLKKLRRGPILKKLKEMATLYFSDLVNKKRTVKIEPNFQKQNREVIASLVKDGYRFELEEISNIAETKVAETKQEQKEQKEQKEKKEVKDEKQKKEKKTKGKNKDKAQQSAQKQTNTQKQTNQLQKQASSAQKQETSAAQGQKKKQKKSRNNQESSQKSNQESSQKSNQKTKQKKTNLLSSEQIRNKIAAAIKSRQQKKQVKITGVSLHKGVEVFRNNNYSVDSYQVLKQKEYTHYRLWQKGTYKIPQQQWFTKRNIVLRLTAQIRIPYKIQVFKDKNTQPVLQQNNKKHTFVFELNLRKPPRYSQFSMHEQDQQNMLQYSIKHYQPNINDFVITNVDGKNRFFQFTFQENQKKDTLVNCIV